MYQQCIIKPQNGVACNFIFINHSLLKHAISGVQLTSGTRIVRKISPGQEINAVGSNTRKTKQNNNTKNSKNHLSMKTGETVQMQFAHSRNFMYKLYIIVF